MMAAGILAGNRTGKTGGGGGPGIVASDNFNRADGGLGANWTTTGGNLRIASNVAENTNIAEWSQACHNTQIGNGSQSIYVQATINGTMIGAANYPGLVLSESNSTIAESYYMSFGGNDSTIYLTRRTGGSSTDIATDSWTVANGLHTIRLEWNFSTSTLDVYYDGVVVTWGSGSNVNTAVTPMYAGIQAYCASGRIAFDDWEAGTL